MADETPTLRLHRQATFGNGDIGGKLSYGDEAAYLHRLPADAWAALAAALDPRTTEVLFEQRDTAIERAKAAEDERDELLEAYTSRRPASEAALLQRLRAERDTAIEERDRLRQTLATVDAERAQLAIEVRRLEALTRIVDITRLGDADQQLRCNTCGHVKAEPREGDRA